MSRGKSTSTSVKVVTFILCILFLAVGFVLGFAGQVIFNRPESDSFVSGDISFHFLELGNKYNGDCIYIKCGENDILIDAGSRQSSASTIIEYLDNYVEDGILEYVIATHSDEDHIGAFASSGTNMGIFEKYDVEVIIDFNNYNSDTSTLRNYIEARDSEIENGAIHYTGHDCFYNVNGAPSTFQLSDDVEMEILYNYYYTNTSSSNNDYSVCVMFNQGDYHYLFTGDLEEKGEEYLVEYYESIGSPLPNCVLYKAGHHGSRTSSSTVLMQAIQPEYVVVSCCAGYNQYGANAENVFPSQKFIDNVAPYTENIFVTTLVDGEGYTSMNGDIIFSIVNGEKNIYCSNNTTILKDTAWFQENRVWNSSN